MITTASNAATGLTGIVSRSCPAPCQSLLPYQVSIRDGGREISVSYHPDHDQAVTAMIEAINQPKGVTP